MRPSRAVYGERLRREGMCILQYLLGRIVAKKRFLVLQTYEKSALLPVVGLSVIVERPTYKYDVAALPLASRCYPRDGRILQLICPLTT